jgi:hypothetical protein
MRKAFNFIKTSSVRQICRWFILPRRYWGKFERLRGFDYHFNELFDVWLRGRWAQIQQINTANSSNLKALTISSTKSSLSSNKNQHKIKRKPLASRKSTQAIKKLQLKPSNNISFRSQPISTQKFAPLNLVQPLEERKRRKEIFLLILF